MNDSDYMRRAIHLAERSVERGGGPFGAVIVLGGDIVAESSNSVTEDLDPTAHAEVMAIRRACKALDRFSLEGGVIYSSCEPCPMCLGAIYWARLDRLVYANDRNDAALIGFDDRHIYEQLAKPIEQQSLPVTRLLADEARAAFQAWQDKPDKTAY
ncbi:MAG: nucleoside deaminase [Alphaproteobacteria bacterium]